MTPVLAGRVVRRLLGRNRQRRHVSVPFDNTWEWVNDVFAVGVQNPECARREQYLWGVLQGVALARVLGYERVSVLELGVAGGAGLLALERIAAFVESVVGVGIEAYGFDSGVGLPEPIDYRDLPFMFAGAGQFPMDAERLRTEMLHPERLFLGPVADTVPIFSGPAVAFAAFDLDYYTSTRDALRLLSVPASRLLPRVVCYFDDIVGYGYADQNGARLAIAEWNAGGGMLSPIYGLRYFGPPSARNDLWVDCMYLAHLTSHPRYNDPDQLRKPKAMDIDGDERFV